MGAELLLCAILKRCFRGSLHGGASCKVEMTHFAARKKDLENRKESKVAPPSVPPPEALYDISCSSLLLTAIKRD